MGLLEVSGAHCVCISNVSVSVCGDILTDLSKKGADDALDEDQGPGVNELLVLLAVTIIATSAGRVRRGFLMEKSGVSSTVSKLGKYFSEETLY